MTPGPPGDHAKDMDSPTENAASAPLRLDPRTLGRPVHLLGKFTALLQEDLAEVLRLRLNRRYRAAFELGAVSIERLDGAPPALRWMSFDTPTGRLCCALERRLALCVLDYRYGTVSAPEDLDRSPETATEERLAGKLARLFVGALVDRITALAPPNAPLPATPARELGEVLGGAPGNGTWLIRAEVEERQRGIRATLWLAPDDGWMELLFRGLSPARARAGARGHAHAQLASALQLELKARLLEIRLPLGALLDALPGDVIPVKLGPTDVLVGDSLLFQATVAEHKGKLCLTSFKDVE